VSASQVEGRPVPETLPGPVKSMLSAHPATDIFPLITGADFDALISDIREHGQLEAIVMYGTLVLDGRNRYRACIELGIAPTTVQWDERGTPEAYVISKNVHRRHLDQAQRRDLIAALLKAGPQKSNRQIADALGVSPSTVITTRAKLEEKGMVSKLDTITGKDGVQQPARKPNTTKARGAKPEKVEAAATALADTDTAKATESQDDTSLDDLAKEMAGDLEREREDRLIWAGEQIAISGSDGLVDEIERLMVLNKSLEARVGNLNAENSELQRKVKWWRKQAMALGCKARTDG